jgi:hypothetical protein
MKSTMTEQYTHTVWFFDQLAVYRAVQHRPGNWAVTREVLGAGLLELGNYNTLRLAQAAIKNDERQGL